MLKNKQKKKCIHITFSLKFILILIRFPPSPFSSAAQAAELTGCVYKEPGMNSSALLSHLMLGFKKEGEGSFEVQISRRNAVIQDQFLILNSLSFHGTDVNPCHLTVLGTNLHHILPPTHTIIYTLKSCTLKFQHYEGGEEKKYIFLLSSLEESFWETLTLPSSSPWSTPPEHLLPSFMHNIGGGEQQGAECCWSETLRRAWVGSAGHSFIGLRYSQHIWSYVVFTVSLLSDQSIRWKKSCKRVLITNCSISELCFLSQHLAYTAE